MTADSQNKLSKPIIILGAPRSGTSVLARIIGQHPDVSILREPRLVWRYGNDAKSDILEAADARPEVVDYIQQRLGTMLEAEGGGRMLEKTPSNSLRVPFVDRVFPDARYLHILRNGYDATMSIQSYWRGHTGGVTYGRIDQNESILKQRIREMHPSQFPYYLPEFLGRFMPHTDKSLPKTVWGPRLPAMMQYVKSIGLLPVCALQWRTCTELACHHGRQLGSERYRELWLHQLNRDTVAALLEFLELDFVPEIESYFETHFDKRKPSARHSEATEQELAQMRPWVEPTMQWLQHTESPAVGIPHVVGG